MTRRFFSPEGNLEDYYLDEYELLDQYVGDQLWVWGNNNESHLGINDTIDRSTPVTTFAGGNTWSSLSARGGVKLDGSLWTWGSNSEGELAVNDTIERLTPVTTFAGGNDWKFLSSSGGFRAAVKVDGSLWVWGDNEVGQLGIGTTSSLDTLTPVTTYVGGNDWKRVSTGNGFILALKKDGGIWGWGDNRYGNIGVGDTNLRNTPTLITNFYDWKDISTGGNHSMGLKQDGTLWTWGRNNFGQLGIGTTEDRHTPVEIYGGGYNWKTLKVGGRGDNSIAIKTDGTLWVWGSGTFGKLGTNDTTNRLTPVTTFAGGTNWKQVSSGGLNHTAAIKTDGTLWVWGRGHVGQLGTNSITDRSTPVTTFAGGSNWKSALVSGAFTYAITNGTNPNLYLS